jgi:hypothetical protein
MRDADALAPCSGLSLPFSAWSIVKLLHSGGLDGSCMLPLTMKCHLLLCEAALRTFLKY